LAQAKINLALHVIGRRADGYHLLDSLVAFADFGDLIHVETAADLSLHLTGPKAADLTSGPDNLVLRAAAAFEAGAKGARITLDKHLPVASGIGGGSADAAAALQALSALWGCPLPKAASVLALGADVPVCLVGRPARMEGIGEKVTPLSLPQAFIVLANPGVGLATASVFAALTRRDNAPLPAPAAWPDAAALAHWLHAARNDLEPPAQALAPVIGTVLAALGRQQGCLLARMSGSGATCFGLFATAAQAEAAAAALARAEAAWWVQAGALAV
jgi:4-diphosphocytidyl-2-C-methyl-D-erythritol kinase